MTIPEFLDRLRQTPERWYLSGEAVRCRRDQCPIVVVHGEGWESEEFLFAAKELGLSDADAGAIARAADSAMANLDLRRQLLAATVERSA